MDWDDFRYLLAVKREGTLTGAAATLGVTRTTVGRRLREAEDRLGVRLLDRTPDGLVPTPAGDDLAETALRLESEVLTAEGRVLGRDAELRGRLRVSTVGFVFDGFPEIFATFVERYPGIDLTLQTTNEQVSLIRREADVALRLGNHPPENLVGRRVGRLQFEAYAARSLVERVGPGAKLSDYPWIHGDERSDQRWQDVWMAAHAPGARIVLRTDDYTARRTAIVAGIGVHFLPCFIGDPDPRVVRVGARLTAEARDLWLLTLPDLRQNSRIRAFFEHTHQAFAARQSELDGAPQAIRPASSS